MWSKSERSGVPFSSSDLITLHSFESSNLIPNFGPELLCAWIEKRTLKGNISSTKLE